MLPVPSYNLYSLRAFSLLLKKHLKKYLLQYWKGKVRGCSSAGGPGFSVPAQETSQLLLNGST